jgi:hypothetical protein
VVEVFCAWEAAVECQDGDKDGADFLKRFWFSDCIVLLE